MRTSKLRGPVIITLMAASLGLPCFVRAQSEARFGVDLIPETFEGFTELYAQQGRQLVDLETPPGPTAGFSIAAIWAPLPPGYQVHKIVMADNAAWSAFLAEMRDLDGRWLDVEVDYINGQKLRSGIFAEGGPDYSNVILTTLTDAELEAEMKSALRNGRQIIDIEHYEENGEDRYAAFWSKSPRQPKTSLFRDMTLAEYQTLLNPMQGRIIDVEYYTLAGSTEPRYAMILANYPGGGWGVFRNHTPSGLNIQNDQVSDSNTQIIDVEAMPFSQGSTRFMAAWGDHVGAMLEVEPVDPDPVSIPLDATITALITNFEMNGWGVIGLSARNLRTGESWARSADDSFYSASSTKIAMHIRLYQLFEQGVLDPDELVPFTNGAATPEPWYMEDRCAPGFAGAINCPSGCTPCANDWGQSFTLSRYDEGMMGVSDNAATTLLVEHPEFGLNQQPMDLNEWISRIDGVAQGWGITTSIGFLDAWLARAATRESHTDGPSFVNAPDWVSEPWLRGMGDLQGRLLTYLGTTGYPAKKLDDGYYRYFNMGLNTGTPRSFVNLLDKFWSGEFMGPEWNDRALDSQEFSPLSSHPNFPAHVRIFDKGGTKGRQPIINGDYAVSDNAIFMMGPDAIAVSVMTRNNARTAGNLRTNHMQPIGLAVLRGLGTDLRTKDRDASGTAPYTFHPSNVAPGGTLLVSAVIENVGGGTSGNFGVSFYLSTDEQITLGDRFIGTIQVAPMPGRTPRTIGAVLTVPANVPVGSYHLGWIIDPPLPTSFGAVGEYNESNNTGRYPTQVFVDVAATPAPSPTPSPVPSPTASPTPQPTATVTPSPTPLPTETPKPTETPVVQPGDCVLIVRDGGFEAGPDNPHWFNPDGVICELDDCKLGISGNFAAVIGGRGKIFEGQVTQNLSSLPEGFSRTLSFDLKTVRDGSPSEALLLVTIGEFELLRMNQDELDKFPDGERIEIDLSLLPSANDAVALTFEGGCNADGGDGAFVVDNVEVTLCVPLPTPTPTQTPVPSPTAVPSTTPIPSPSPTVVATPSPTPDPGAPCVFPVKDGSFETGPDSSFWLDPEGVICSVAACQLGIGGQHSAVLGGRGDQFYGQISQTLGSLFPGFDRVVSFDLQTVSELTPNFAALVVRVGDHEIYRLNQDNLGDFKTPQRISIDFSDLAFGFDPVLLTIEGGSDAIGGEGAFVVDNVEVRSCLRLATFTPIPSPTPEPTDSSRPEFWEVQ